MISIREQVKILKEKGLKFSREKEARRILLDYNYYNVINGYKDIFIDKSSVERKYKKGTTFDDIFSLYNFDMRLKLLFLKYIFIVEQNIKSHLSYEFSLLYGEVGYQDRKNFSADEADQKKFEALVKNTIKTILKNNNSDDRITQYKNIDVPIYVLISLFDLGNTRFFYSICKEGLKRSISKKYYNLTPTQFNSCFNILKSFRNICAHGLRLYCAAIDKRLADLPIHEKMNLKHQQVNNQKIYIVGKNDLFSLVIALYYLLGEKDFKEFFVQLKREIKKIGNKLGSKYSKEILNKMYFPEKDKRIKQRGWKEILRVCKEKAK